MPEGTTPGGSNSGGNTPAVLNYKISLTGAHATHIKTAQVLKLVSSTFENTSGDEKAKATPEENDVKNILKEFTEKIANIMGHLGMLERQKKICIKYLESSENRAASPYITTMNQLDAIITTITKSNVAEFQKKMSDGKNDLLEWKEFLGSEAVLALNTFLANQLVSSKTVGNTPEEAQGHINSYRNQALNYIRSVMCVKRMNGLETQGHIDFDPEKRVTKKLDSLKVSPPGERGTVEEIGNIIDFINFLLQQIDLILEKNQLESNRTKKINHSNRPKKEDFLDSKEATRVLLETLIPFFKENSDTEFSREDNTRVAGADHIIAYQRALSLLSIPVTIDGVYGPKTMLAIQKFQMNHNLNSRNGTPGPETTQKILEKLIVLDENLQKQANSLIGVTEITETPEKQIEKYLATKGYTRDRNRVGLKVNDQKYIDQKGIFTITIIGREAKFQSTSILKNTGILRYSEEETEIMKTINAILPPPASK